MAIMEDEKSLAARVLADVGVTGEAIRAKADEIGVEGTSDEMPAPKPKRQRPVRVDLGEGIEVRITDPEAVESLRGAAGVDERTIAEVVREVLRQRLGADEGEAKPAEG